MQLKDIKILAIDDASSIRTFLRISLQSHGAHFYEAPTAIKGLEKLEEVHPDLIVLDLGLPDKDGFHVLSEIKQKYNGKSPHIIILTVRKEQRVREKAFELGANAYLTKPFIMEDLLEIIFEKFDTTQQA